MRAGRILRAVGRQHEQVPGLAPGKAGMRQLFGMFHSAFDHAGVAVDDMIAEGDKVFVRARMTGTQRGDFMGVPATGGTLNVSLCDYRNPFSRRTPRWPDRAGHAVHVGRSRLCLPGPSHPWGTRVSPRRLAA